jgi:hypothetical protein
LTFEKFDENENLELASALADGALCDDPDSIHEIEEEEAFLDIKDSALERLARMLN